MLIPFEGFFVLFRKSNQTDEGAQGKQFSLLLLEPKSNQKASAHLRWLFARSSAHEKNALLSGISFKRSSHQKG